MGTQFWWFYDVMAAAIILACMFIWGRKGIFKSVLALTSCFLAAVIAFGVSAGIAKTVYSSTVRVSNIKKINANIEDGSFLSAYAAYLESLGYNIRVDKDKLEVILSGKGDYTEEICRYVNNINGRKVEKNDDILRQKVCEGYASVISNIVSVSLKNKYASEITSITIMEEGNIDELMPLIAGAEVERKAAEYIVDNYTADAYYSLFRLGTVLAMFVVLAIFIGFIMKSFTANRDELDKGISDHVIGGAVGAVTGAVFVLAAAVVVRLWAIMGSNEMLFFNNEAVDKTYAFRFFYNMIMKM